MKWLAGTIVVATGFWLVGLALLMMFAPTRAERFLTGFASSARAHYIEQIVRLIAGSAIVIYSHELSFPGPWRVFGWIIVITTVGLLLIPWQWHHRFAKWAIPLAIRHIKLYGLVAFVLGMLLLFEVLAY